MLRSNINRDDCNMCKYKWDTNCKHIRCGKCAVQDPYDRDCLCLRDADEDELVTGCKYYEPCRTASQDHMHIDTESYYNIQKED